MVSGGGGAGARRAPRSFFDLQMRALEITRRQERATWTELACPVRSVTGQGRGRARLLAFSQDPNPPPLPLWSTYRPQRASWPGWCVALEPRDGPKPREGPRRKEGHPPLAGRATARLQKGWSLVEPQGGPRTPEPPKTSRLFHHTIRALTTLTASCLDSLSQGGPACLVARDELRRRCDALGFNANRETRTARRESRIREYASREVALNLSTSRLSPQVSRLRSLCLSALRPVRLSLSPSRSARSLSEALQDPWP